MIKSLISMLGVFTRTVFPVRHCLPKVYVLTHTYSTNTWHETCRSKRDYFIRIRSSSMRLLSVWIRGLPVVLLFEPCLWLILGIAHSECKSMLSVHGRHLFRWRRPVPGNVVWISLALFEMMLVHAYPTMRRKDVSCWHCFGVGLLWMYAMRSRSASKS